MKLRFPVIFFLAMLAVLRAQHGSTPDRPFSTPEDEAVGAKSFRSQCAACHGPEASGGVVGPSLTTGTFKNGGSDEALFRGITKGLPWKGLTGFNLNGRGG